MSLGSGFAVFLNHCKYRHEHAGPGNPRLAQDGQLQHDQYGAARHEQRPVSPAMDQLADARDDIRTASSIQPRRPSSISSEASH
ncbi:hypothetical protein UCRNP2_3143 [Neofusicoccum parvum UCRNP2]|uniref:Uncharacterized protein n=1 Tax=Botryosphaeria parva (strain UCR-NP2) TaxID=1287680 RepID=R1EQN2_BOTPV|nr:hypothetical protein UCRNP2_3143 [Neofusicoccum parvum UCRNP2]